jgi:hypothetical protein
MNLKSICLWDMGCVLAVELIGVRWCGHRSVTGDIMARSPSIRSGRDCRNKRYGNIPHLDGNDMRALEYGHDHLRQRVVAIGPQPKS